MLTLHIEAESLTDLRAKVFAALGQEEMPSGATIPLAEAPKTRGRTPKTETPAAVIQTDESPLTEAGPAPAAPEASDDPNRPLAYEADIKPAVLRVSAHPIDQGGGREGVLKLMAQFDVDHISKVPEDQWPALLDAINAVLEG